MFNISCFKYCILGFCVPEVVEMDETGIAMESIEGT
jgi:hypothetical protein